MNKKTSTSASDDIILNLNVLAAEKEDARQKLAITAGKLAMTAKKLAITANEKERVRRKLAITALEKERVRRKLAITATKLATTAKKLAVTAMNLRISHETLERKVSERTKSLEIVSAKEGAILLSIGDGLIATDEIGIIILINKTAEKLLGKRREDVVGRPFSNITLFENETSEPIPLEMHPVSMALRNGTTTTGTTYYNMLKDETRFPVSITVTPVILNGNVIGTIKIFRDITYERDIDKAKTEFVSLASHQLRTPLSTVNWYAEMLLAGDVGELNKRQIKYLQEVYASNQRMVELVNALLDVSSLELGTFVIEPRSTNICVLARNVIHEQKPQINIKKVRFQFICSKNIPHMQADPKLLRMVLQNILSNSIKYTPTGGKIKLSISVIKKRVQIKISDTGYGIPKKQHHKIFTKLFRADNVREKDTDGTGLGLYIVKSIVEKSGGKIWFESPVEDKGTTFFVTLPIKSEVIKSFI